MKLIKHNKREVKEIFVFNVVHTVLKLIQDSRWRKKCKRLIMGARCQLVRKKHRMESNIRQSRVCIFQLLNNGYHKDALARVEQLHKDQRVFSAYQQIEDFLDCIHFNFLAKQSKMTAEVSEALSSLVFAASRCGELSDLQRIRTHLIRRFGSEFGRVNVELLPGNCVDTQLRYNLGNDSVPEEEKLLISSKISREYQHSLELQTCEQNFVPQNQEKKCDPEMKNDHLELGIEDVKKIDRKVQRKDSRIKHIFHRIGSKISSFNSTDLATLYVDDPCDNLPNRTPSDSSPPIQDKAVICLDEMAKNKASNKELKEERDEDDDSNPRLSHVHPKLPDYDELVATFTEYKKEHVKNNSNNRESGKWVRW